MAGKRPREATIVRSGFAALVIEVKGRIQAAQTRAMLAVNAELVLSTGTSGASSTNASSAKVGAPP